jgi:integrase
VGTVYKRGGKWWIQYYVNGLRLREPASNDKREAAEALKVREAEIIQGTFRQSFHIKRRDRKRIFDDMVTEYIEIKANKRSLRCDRSIFNDMKTLPMFKGRLLSNITADDIEKYRETRRERASGATVNRSLALLSNMFTVAIRLGYAEKNPVKGIKRFKESPGKRRRFIFSPDEIQGLMAAAPDHLRPILTVAFWTGLRKGDILGLRWDNVDFAGHTITLTMEKTEEPIIIPMVPGLEETLRKLHADSEPGFPYVFKSVRSKWKMRDGKRIRGEKGAGEFSRPGDIKNAFSAALVRSGLGDKGYWFHDIRRTFATTLWNRGVSLLTIKALLGHKSIMTTERYLGVKMEEERKAIMSLGPVWGESLAESLPIATIQPQLAGAVDASHLLSDGLPSQALPS